MKTVVLDYGVGNLASVSQGLEHAGLKPLVTNNKEEILRAKAIVLPGVGAFPQGMENLQKFGLLPIIKEAVAAGTPFLGICLGMQLLFEESDEYGRHQGLGFLTGRVGRFPPGLKVPHMGWNTLMPSCEHPLLKGVKKESYVYFVHSYQACGCDPSQIVASTIYGVEFPAIVCFNNIVGTQFHPEKSSRIGLTILRNFKEMVDNGGNPSH